MYNGYDTVDMIGCQMPQGILEPPLSRPPGQDWHDDSSTGGMYDEVEEMAVQNNDVAGPKIRDVPAVTKAIAILRLLANSNSPLGLNEIARRLNFFPSTCLHTLRVLVREELVSADGSKQYRLAAGLLTLSRPLLRQGSLGRRVQPMLDRTAEALNLTLSLIEIMGHEHFVVIAVSRTDGIRLQIDVGARQPALLSATGRCVAAFGGFDDATLEAEFRRLRWDNPMEFSEWLRQVRVVRECGYSVDKGNYIRGMTAVAVPVWNDSVPHFSLTAVGFTDQVNQLGIETVAKALQAIVHAVAPDMGLRSAQTSGG